MLDKLKEQLIEDWRSIGRFWSVRLSGAGLGLGVLLQSIPDAAMNTWNSLPGDLKAVLPVHFVNWISYALIAAGIFARVVKQKPKSNG